MANILFPGQAIGLIVLPLMLFHQAQLFICATMAQRYAKRAAGMTPAKPARQTIGQALPLPNQMSG